MRMPALGVGDGQQPHELAQLAILPGPKNQMPVIGHQAIADNAHRPSLDGSLDNPLESQVILAILKYGPPSNRPVEHVVNNSAGGSPETSRHGMKNTDEPNRCQRLPTPLNSVTAVKDSRPL